MRQPVRVRVNSYRAASRVCSALCTTVQYYMNDTSEGKSRQNSTVQPRVDETEIHGETGEPRVTTTIVL